MKKENKPKLDKKEVERLKEIKKKALQNGRIVTKNTEENESCNS